MIEMRSLKSVVIFLQPTLSLVKVPVKETIFVILSTLTCKHRLKDIKVIK